MGSHQTLVMSCGNSETRYSLQPSSAPQCSPKPPLSSLQLLTFMTLLIQLPDIILKMYALSIWSQNELLAEIIGSLQDVDNISVTVPVFIISKPSPNLFQTADLDFKGTSRFTDLNHRV